MDIENMHPFCLPFGLCHDATSSSITADLVPVSGQNDGISTAANGTTTSSSSSSSSTSSLSSSVSPLSPSSKEKRLSNQRAKNLSPSDELFRQLNSISSTTILDIIDDEVEAALNGLNDDNEENRLRKSSIGTDIGFTDNDQKMDEAENEEEEEPIDWYYGEYSLFSPTRRKSLSLSTSSATAAAIRLHQQVFQHLVDPIDIKSSPTLAQLNLNSNDNDPIDGFWDTTTATSSSANNHTSSLSSSSSSSSSAPTNTDLLSNCTSINKNSLTAGTCCSRTLSHNDHHHNHSHTANNSNSSNNITSVCNHLNHHSQTQHHHAHQHHLSSSTSYSSTAHLIASNPQQQQQSNYQQPPYQQQQQQFACRSSALQGSTRSVVDPFTGSKPDLHQNHHNQSTCCQHSTNNNKNENNNNNNTGTNLTASATPNQLNQFDLGGAARNLPAAQVCSEQDPKRRPSSPVLVTSSSSPLSSTITPGQQQSQQPFLNGDANPRGPAGESTKLKENIEYLTALLCNGNKLDTSSQHQPSSISSSMARSYSTLAHTLSTGPKLLERPIQHQPEITTVVDHQIAKIVSTALTNEAAPCMDADPQSRVHPSMQHQQQQNHQPQWIKVESSISAADSTESQTLPYPLQPGHDCLHHHHQAQSMAPKLLPLQQQQRCAPDLRVLSSLLSGGAPAATKCPEVCTNHPIMAPNGLCPRWPPAALQHHQTPIQPQPASADQSASMASVEAQQRSSPIPVNGRPITLTPIASHNNPILQQHHQAVSSKTIKSSPFIQPASPSASSTASSGANTDIGSSNSGPTIKKPRLSSHAQSGATKLASPAHKSSTGGGGSSSSSNRSARPNSMSTDGCSLSSHDEGFSSQIDNDDCNSNRDSDEEDEVDSDDESFYGDYTNNDLIGASISDDPENKWTLNMGRTRRNGQKRYFWQYNVQSKGPKGTRICSADDSQDPFVLPEASDPVFSNDCQVEGVKHSGKARRGDGNDLTPNPKKLLMIGLELKKLGKIINELAPVTDLPINARTKTRKEKNKLASRACRLKKKAQHEANKIKLYGLQREHQQIVLAIYDVRKLLNQALRQKDNGVGANTMEGGDSQTLRQSSTAMAASEQPSGPTADNSSQLTTPASTTNDACTNAKAFSIAEQCSMRVAGQTSDFVNSVLEKVVSGCIDGGLDT